VLPSTAARRTMSCDTTLHGIARPGSMKKAICANSGAAHTPARAQLAWSFASFRCVIDLSPYRQTASLEHEDRREPVGVLGVSGAKDTPQRDLCRIWSQGSADTHPTRGLVRPVHCNRRPVLAQRNLGKGGTDFTSRPICWTQASTVSMVGVSTSTSRLISWTTVRSASISSGRPFSRSWSTTCAPTPATPLIRRSTSPGNARRPGGRSFGLLHHRRATMRVPGSHDVERRVSAESRSRDYPTARYRCESRGGFWARDRPPKGLCEPSDPFGLRPSRLT